VLRGWERWTVEEDEKLLREYKLKGATKLSKEMKNRTIHAIMQRHSILTQSNKPIKRIHETQIDKCPFCGSSRINKVNTWLYNVVEAYYCVNCLKEFLPNGKLIPPLYADSCEGW
jgi:DNA-directed RNA polymerase subunit RPC12/RpoP